MSTNTYHASLKFISKNIVGSPAATEDSLHKYAACSIQPGHEPRLKLATMRLLHSRDRKFRSFDGEIMPPYAILSHTWGDEEVTYQDMIAWRQGSNCACEKKGFLKIDLTCNQADHDGLDWVWIDTCNIDKTSSSELSEAINSMFQWYQKATICYAYLEDVSYEDLRPQKEGVVSSRVEALSAARWFSRGWTLQELIASAKIEFYCAVSGHTQWFSIGSKISESNALANITGIDKAVLNNPNLLTSTSVARRMSWAAQRQTTRPEDMAYCLLGIFHVNMPLIYGEGKNAFIRLQEEILKNTEDESLFAWTDFGATAKAPRNDGILATHPRAFKDSAEVVPYASDLEPYTMTNRGLRIERRFFTAESNTLDHPSISCVLHCHFANYFNSSIVITLELDTSTNRYCRSGDRNLRSISNTVAGDIFTKTIYIHKHGTLADRKVRHCCLSILPERRGFRLDKGVAFEIEHGSTIPGPGFPRSSRRGSAGGAMIAWDMNSRSLLAPVSSNGYYSALTFSRRANGERGPNHDIFIALLVLPGKTERSDVTPPLGVQLIHSEGDSKQTESHVPHEGEFQRLGGPESQLELNDGIVITYLKKERYLNENTYVLDIVFKPESEQVEHEQQSLGPPSHRQDFTVVGIARRFLTWASQDKTVV